MNTYDQFAETMRQKYGVAQLVAFTQTEFKRTLQNFLNLQDSRMERFDDPSRQRDLSIRFHWGHDHDFGDFKLEGRMADRHLRIPAKFVDDFKVLPIDMTGKRILDVGVWTGGTSLLFAALGAEVIAIEEVKKYSDAVEFLKKAFDVRNLTIRNISLYELNDGAFFDRFDYVFLSGVIYHVTDPVLALRVLFNALKDGGRCLVESFAIDHEQRILRYDGPTTFGSGCKEDLSRSGWNWFVPSRATLEQMMRDVGFEEVRVEQIENARALAVGLRSRHCDMLRAGLSVRTIR